jgi:hypothetical protein
VGVRTEMIVSGRVSTQGHEDTERVHRLRAFGVGKKQARSYKTWAPQSSKSCTTALASYRQAADAACEVDALVIQRPPCFLCASVTL